MLTTTYITDRLATLATERGVTIRYANESGSRAWGLASTDSDYDVRFVYQQPKEWYLRLDRPKDMIGPLMELDGELDLAGWDIRKVLFHLAGSNAGVIEWLYSPTVYFRDAAFLEQLRELASTQFQARKVAAHYLGVSRSARLAGYSLTEKDWNLKKYFYYLRPLLAAEFVLTEKRVPPVAFAELVGRLEHPVVRTVINDLISQKREVTEDYRMVVPGVVENYFVSLRTILTGQVAATPRRTVNRGKADAVFREMIGY